MVGQITPNLSALASLTQKNEFAKLLSTKDDQKIAQFIRKNPQLLHQPLLSGYTPIEYAVASKNPTSIRVLVEKGAKINAANSKGISPFDQLILMNDYPLLSKTFSPYFSQQVEKLSSELKPHLQNPEFQNGIQRQLKGIYSQALRLSQNCFFDLDSALKDSIEKENMQDLRSLLEKDLQQKNHHNIFKAVIYGVMSHKNQVIKIAHELINEEILNFRTTDLFNLYHLATLFNNAEAIRTLNKLGLSEHLEKTEYKDPFSPYYFAIISPELKVFEALVGSKLSLPDHANLKSAFSLKNTIAFSPMQLWIAKAYLVDPMPKITFLEQFKTLSAIAYLAFDYFSILPSSSLKDFYSLFYLTLQTMSNLSLLTERNSWISSIIIAGLSIYLQQAGLLKNTLGINNLSYLTLTLKLVNILSSIQKITQEFKAYSQTFYYRPLQTLKSFSFKLIGHSLNLAFILQDFKHATTQKTFEEPQPQEPPHHNPYIDEKIINFRNQLALNTKEDNIKKIIDCFEKYNPFNETSHKINYLDTLDCLGYKYEMPLNWTEIHRAFKALSIYVHTDKCSLYECLAVTKAITNLSNRIKTNNLP